MNVVFLAKAWTKRQQAGSNHWTPDEAAQLVRLYNAKRRQGNAASFAYGATDLDDPQFYVLSTDNARSCNACISRLSRDGRSWYVIENGQGGIETEGNCLRTLIAQITAGWRPPMAILAFFAQDLLNDGIDAVGIVAAAGCIVGIV
jgi:hypothetical protein